MMVTFRAYLLALLSSNDYLIIKDGFLTEFSWLTPLS